MSTSTKVRRETINLTAKYPPGFTKLMVDQYIACCYAGALVRKRSQPDKWDLCSYIAGCLVWFCVNKLDAHIPFSWVVPVMAMSRDPFEGPEAEAFVEKARKKWPALIARIDGGRR